MVQGKQTYIGQLEGVVAQFSFCCSLSFPRFAFVVALALCLRFFQAFLSTTSCYGFWFFMFMMFMEYVAFVLVKDKVVVVIPQLVFGSPGWLQMLWPSELQQEEL